MSTLRYGFYLRPSPAMCRAQAEIHALLERQYGLRVAGRFMPHATIKGFFRSDASQTDLVAALDQGVAGRAAFTVYNRGLVAHGRSGIALNVQQTPTGATNEPLQALHEAAWAALLPFVHPDCDFTPREWAGSRFHAHLTLAMTDLPERWFDEILAFLRDLEPIGPASFRADTLHLYAFTSDAWAGAWWESLRWTHMYTWVLA